MILVRVSLCSSNYTLVSTNNKPVASDANSVALLTKEDMLDFVIRKILPSSHQRAKLSVHIIASGTSGVPRVAAGTQDHNRYVYSLDWSLS
jgi:autotransporter adhesin